jgi:ABC-type phosphate/phosphonate transport system substrate-binding protein
MKKIWFPLLVAMIVVLAWGIATTSRAKQNDQQQIVELERGLISATNAKNVNEI